jgi:hypothetical protein
MSLFAGKQHTSLLANHPTYPKTEKTNMEVLYFCPSREKTIAEKLPVILQAGSPETGKPKVEILNETSPAGGLENKKFDAVVIVYTAEVELSERLFEIVRFIEREKPLGRFIFLPSSGGKEVIPSIFHPIRALQLQLFYYSPSVPLEACLAEFEEGWSKFMRPVQVEASAKRGRGNRVRQAGFGLILSASIFILFMVGIIAEIVPIAQKSVLNLTPTAICPPAATAFWLRETFQPVDTTTRWQEQHYYSGKQALITEQSVSGLRLSAAPAVAEAVYQLDSRQSWPLDDLQSLTFSFTLTALDDPAAINALVVGLILSEDSSYQLECLIFTGKADGKVQCQIQSPEQTEALSNAVALSLDKKHTVTLGFDPQTYSIKFFLDNQYFGENEIKDVQYWRTRSINLHLQVRLQNMNSGVFSCELDNLDLAHQPIK